MDHRGQNIEEKLNNVSKGLLYERQMILYMRAKYDIHLIKNPYQYGAYDFKIKGDDSIYIEYKALQIKKVIDDQPFQYEFIVIPCSKIDHYAEIYQKGLIKNKRKHFIYLISLFYQIDNIQHKQHKYLYLNIENIQKYCSVITNVLGNGVDKVPHYQLKHEYFKPVETLKDTLNDLKNTVGDLQVKGHKA